MLTLQLWLARRHLRVSTYFYKASGSDYWRQQRDSAKKDLEALEQQQHINSIQVTT